MTFARFATVAVPLPPRDPGSPRSTGGAAGLPPARRDAVTGRDTALLPLYPAGRRAGNRPTNDRPTNDRPANDRPANDRPANDRPVNDRLPADQRATAPLPVCADDSGEAGR